MSTDNESRIPDSAPKPQDHKKKAKAREAEAAEGFVTIEHLGVQLRVPVGRKVPTRAMLRFRGLNDDLTDLEDNEDGFRANMMGTRELLAPEQWEALLAANPCAEDWQALGVKIREATGN